VDETIMDFDIEDSAVCEQHITLKGQPHGR
jgi:hypothetical protein